MYTLENHNKINRCPNFNPFLLNTWVIIVLLIQHKSHYGHCDPLPLLLFQLNGFEIFEYGVESTPVLDHIPYSSREPVVRKRDSRSNLRRKYEQLKIEIMKM